MLSYVIVTILVNGLWFAFCVKWYCYYHLQNVNRLYSSVQIQCVRHPFKHAEILKCVEDNVSHQIGHYS